MELFPYIIGRTGGGAIDTLSKLKATSTNKALEELPPIKKKINSIKTELVDLIYDAIKKTDDLKAKNKLLNFKRDLYNDRNIATHLSYLHTQLGETDPIMTGLNEYLAQEERYKALLDKTQTIYQEDLKNAIVALGEITDSPYLKNGLLFSSPTSLRDQIEKFSFDTATLNKKQRRLIFSLLKYITRSTTKTTPFSSFNAIFCLKENGNNYTPLSTGEKPSNMTLNNLVYYYLQTLLLQSPEVKNVLEIRLNDTILALDDSYHYFTNFENNEFFKKVGKSEIVNFILEFLTKPGKIYYQDLVEELSKATGEPTENARPFVEQLITEGIIYIKYPVSNHDRAWPDRLLDFLKSEFSPESSLLVEKTIRLLETLRSVAVSLEKEKSTATRELILQKTHQQLISFSNEIDHGKAEVLNKVHMQDLFYEDTLREYPGKLSKKPLDNTLEDIALLNNLFSATDPKQNAKNKIASHINQLNGAKTVPLLKFYEEVYLKTVDTSFEISKNVLDGLGKTFGNAINQLNADETQEAFDFKEYVNPELSIKNTDSLGLYFQKFTSNDKETLVINNFSSGHGSNISRYLNIYPTEIADCLKEKVAERFPGKIVAEIKDASIHNVNTFPPLAANIINVSMNGQVNDAYTSIPLRDLFISADSSGGVSLQDKEGKTIVPVDFSSEGIHRKSKLFQFIDLFSPSSTFGLPFLHQIIDQVYLEKLTTSKEGLIAIPRIYFGENIVLRRKKWLVSKKELLKVSATGTLQEVYIALNEWKIKKQIPNEVFVKISKTNNYENDNYKPQYIHFEMPLLIMLFQNMLEKADDVIEITEMLPHSSQLPVNSSNKRSVSEYVVSLFQ